ncbi:VOC family protein [Micromonospora sp. NPDC047707]|uniref:VOC family protein n=1 Tax=Micromonospora sp. NPDC047707 TaxID=3154498 RepID=UPI0034544A95
MRVINGAHVVIYSRDAGADRAFFRDVLGYPHVDAGDGWLIFKLPPAEVAVHPAESTSHEFFLTCDDVAATVTDLTAKGVEFTQPVSDEVTDLDAGAARRVRRRSALLLPAPVRRVGAAAGR